MAKLIIQIPCFNEEKTLPVVMRSLPAQIAGVDDLEILVIDDGSTDNTVKVAQALGVHHVLVLDKHQGLASAFFEGVKFCVARGADVIVNFDADNQYRGADIERLVRPILEARADVVLGERVLRDIDTYNWWKRGALRMGSACMSLILGVSTKDAITGFRAFSAVAIADFTPRVKYSYVLDTLFYWAREKKRIASIAINTNASLRPSRLKKSECSYIYQTSLTMVHLLTIELRDRFFRAG
jgi:glycosyltransferase involved in cell wall biosynthesis